MLLRAHFAHPTTHAEFAFIGQVRPDVEVGCGNGPRVTQHLFIALGRENCGGRISENALQLLHVSSHDQAQQFFHRMLASLPL